MSATIVVGLGLLAPTTQAITRDADELVAILVAEARTARKPARTWCNALSFLISVPCSIFHILPKRRETAQIPCKM